MGMLKTALQLAMKGGSRPLRSAADIISGTQDLWSSTRGMRTGRTAASLADEMAANASRTANMVPTGGSSVQKAGGAMTTFDEGGALARQSGAMQPYDMGGALVPDGKRMMPYDAGGPLVRDRRNLMPYAAPIPMVTMFGDPGPMKPMIGPSPLSVPDPTMPPRPMVSPGHTPDIMSPDPMVTAPPPRVPVAPPMIPGVAPPMMAAPDFSMPPMTMPPPNMPMANTVPNMGGSPVDVDMPTFDQIIPQITRRQPSMPMPAPGVQSMPLPGLMPNVPAPQPRFMMGRDFGAEIYPNRRYLPLGP